MPLPGGRLRLFFRDDAASERPTTADAQGVIDRHVPGAPRIRDAENATGFSLHHRAARDFRAGRVMLAGDAAHAMTPVNGQVMNTGVQDAYNLAWKLRLALDGVPPEVLDSYEAERRPVALATVEASGAVHYANVLSGKAPPPATARWPPRSLRPPRCWPPSRPDTSWVWRTATAWWPPVKSRRARLACCPAGVCRMPLLDPDGQTTSLRELMRDPDLQLWLCAGAGSPDRALALAERFATSMRVRLFVIADRAPPTPAGVEAFADPALRVHGRLGAVSNGAYVVRPDG